MPWAKCVAVYNLCFAYRRIERTPEADPLPTFVNALTDNAAYLTALRHALPAEAHPVPAAMQSGVLDVTAAHYGELFKAFDDPSYFDEPVELLRQRLERNGFDLAWLQGKTGLDGGCGNGRYTVALKMLGLAEVHGLISPKRTSPTPNGVATARRSQGFTTAEATCWICPLKMSASNLSSRMACSITPRTAPRASGNFCAF